MNEQAHENRGHSYPHSPTGDSTRVCIAAILVLVVLLAISISPHALAQPGGVVDNQAEQSLPTVQTSPLQHGSTLDRLQMTGRGRSEILRYDVRPKVPVSGVPKGFHNSQELLPDSARTAASNIQQLRPLQPSGICLPTITQSTSQGIVTGSLACSDPGIGTLENHYWRAFNMNTFTGGQAYDITSIEFGIEQADSLFGTDQPLTVNLYANHGSPFPSGDWQSNLLASSGEVRVPNQEFTIFNVPLTTTVPAGTLELVMEVLSPDQTVEHNFFIIGSNPDSESGPSYLSAPDCGNPDPLPVDCFLGPMHYVFNVNGSCAGGGTPTPTPTATASPTPSFPPITITGSIDNSDPTQLDRMNRSGVSSCCGGGPGCVIFGDGQPHHYDAYAFTNTTGSTQCVTVGVNTDCQGQCRLSFIYNDCVRSMRRHNANTNSGAECKCNTNRHPDTDTNTNYHSKTYPDAQSAPNSKGPANASKALDGAGWVRHRRVTTINIKRLSSDYPSNEPFYETRH